MQSFYKNRKTIAMLQIDNININTKYGVTLVNGWSKSLVQYPPLKTPKGNKWRDEDGEDIDLSTPVLNSRNISISFGVHGANYDLTGFMEMLSDKGYHIFRFEELGKSYKLRLVDQSGLKLAPTLGIFTLSFADDDPLYDYNYKTPESNTLSQGYSINYSEIVDNKIKTTTNDLALYGITLLEGSLTELEKTPKVKPSLLRNINSQSGAIYDGEVVNFEAKDVKLNLLMKADTIASFWINYNAFLYDLVRPDERELYLPYKLVKYPFYYKSSSVNRFNIINDIIRCEFSITLQFTSFRTKHHEYILSSELEEMIITEDGKLINLNFK